MTVTFCPRARATATSFQKTADMGRRSAAYSTRPPRPGPRTPGAEAMETTATISSASCGPMRSIEAVEAAPPSTYVRPSISTGGIQAGIAHDARSASPAVAFGAPGAPKATRSPVAGS